MGWNTYHGVGGILDEPTIPSVARALLGCGLAQAGYRIVWLDFGWASGRRDASRRLLWVPPSVAKYALGCRRSPNVHLWRSPAPYQPAGVHRPGVVHSLSIDPIRRDRGRFRIQEMRYMPR